MLTRRQRELLVYLRAYDGANGTAPSFDEMVAAMGYKSKNSVHKLLVGLQERGFIRRMKGRARAIELVPEGHVHFKVRYVTCDHCGRQTTAGMEESDD